MSLSVIMPASGRTTIDAALASCTQQMGLGDEILVLREDTPWGDESRTNMISRATASHCIFLDDDDAWRPYAYDHFRAAIAEDPDALHLFRMQYKGGHVLWGPRTITYGNVSGSQILVPTALAKQVPWAHVVPGECGADYYFIKACAERTHVIWHEQVVIDIRPHQ